MNECRKLQPFVIDVTAHQQSLSEASGSDSTPSDQEKDATETPTAMETDQASTSTAQTTPVHTSNVLLKLPNGKCKSKNSSILVSHLEVHGWIDVIISSDPCLKTPQLWIFVPFHIST